MDVTRSHDPTNNVYPQTKKLVLNVQNTQPTLKTRKQKVKDRYFNLFIIQILLDGGGGPSLFFELQLSLPSFHLPQLPQTKMRIS